MIKYKNIVIFTKTLWDEPPRIRHQLTRLLQSYGHKITFFERSSVKQLQTLCYSKEGIDFVRHFELLHHQLRPCVSLVKLNQLVVKSIINKNTNENNIDLIINFNYDYDFLRDMFPNKKIITIINDDFIAQARPWMQRSITKQLHKTCSKSDMVLTVHYSLHRELKEFNKHTYILFPWAGTRYKSPVSKIGTKRDTVLFWGYIDHRVNWNVIRFLLDNNVKIRFIGNIENSVKDIVEELKLNPNFEILSAMPIESVKFDDVSCSIIPYDANVNGVQAISVSNRTFQLLSYGIPIVHTSLPDLIKSPNLAIAKCKINEDYLNAVEYFSSYFDSCQTDIEEFLKEHYAENRYKYLLEKIDAN